MNTIQLLLNSYPRTRPSLSEEEQTIYQSEYFSSRSGTSFVQALAQKTESWMHKQVGKIPAATILELGAGTLNQIPFENNYKHYDIVEPLQFLYQEQPNLKQVTTVYDEISKIPPSSVYEKISSIAVLEHMVNLPKDIAQAALLLHKDGVFSNAIPSEGGLTWGASWRLTTGLSYKLRTGFPYSNLMRHEHINSASEIFMMIHYFFNQVTHTRWPLPLLHGSLFTYLEAREPNLERCKEYLKNTD